MFIFALLYLATPVFMILFTFFSMPFVVLSAIAIVILIFCLHKTHKVDSNLPPKPLAEYWPLLLIALLAAYYSVVVGFDAPDWKNHFAISNSLIENTWPPVIEVDGQTWFLRYYLSWFVPSALFAKIFGSQAITSAMFAWQFAGMLIALLLLFQNLHRARHLLLAALVFFLFSGIDLVGAYLINSHHLKHITPSWINSWAGTNLFIILPNLTVLQHSPHHAIAAFVSTSLIFCNRRLGLQYSAFILVITTMWSPFCAVGLLPLVALSLYKDDFKTALTPQNLLAAPLLAIPIVLYLTQGTELIPHMFAWQHASFYFPYFVLFCVFEFLLILGIFCYLMKKERSLIVTLGVFLTLLCTYSVGLYADLLIRAAMPAVVIMSVLMLKALLANEGWRRKVLVAHIIIGAIPAVVAFVQGARTPISQIHRNATFEQHLDELAAEDREIHRSQYLLDANYARRYLGSVTLMRNLPSRVEQ